MNVMECVKNGLFYLDGGTGTSLQAMGLASGELPELWNLEHPQKVVELERAYFEAGSHAVATNTFGANGLKFDGRDGRPSLHAVIRAAVHCAKEARDTARGGQKNRFVALDIGRWAECWSRWETFRSKRRWNCLLKLSVSVRRRALILS